MNFFALYHKAGNNEWNKSIVRGYAKEREKRFLYCFLSNAFQYRAENTIYLMKIPYFRYRDIVSQNRRRYRTLGT